MVITYYGGECFKVQTGDTVLAFNPIGKGSQFKPVKFGATVALVTMHDPDFDGIENATYGEKAPFVIQGPGEYEVGGIFIKGFYTETTYKKKQKANTVYALTFDDIRIIFLGALASPEALTSEIKAELGEVDILFAPIAGGEVLSPADAQKLAVTLEAKIVIPMHYGEKDPALTVLEKEAGEKAEVLEKLTLKRKDLEGKDGHIIALTF